MVDIPVSLKGHNNHDAMYDLCECEFCQKERGDVN